jgi:hypothetical protein
MKLSTVDMLRLCSVHNGPVTGENAALDPAYAVEI